MRDQRSLRERLIVRYGNQKEDVATPTIPATGRIDSDVVEIVQDLAERAQSGDNAARDQLFFALRPRLNRISWILRPWPNSDEMTGIWDRDDVRQESWVVFAELLAAWNGNVGFVPYLLSRFGWRLRDRILRGIGRRETQYGETRVPEKRLEGVLISNDSEQPESVALARKLLEELIRQQMSGATSLGPLEAWQKLINSTEKMRLVSPDQLLCDGEGDEQTRVA